MRDLSGVQGPLVHANVVDYTAEVPVVKRTRPPVRQAGADIIGTAVSV